jgi:hypothetical protein
VELQLSDEVHLQDWGDLKGFFNYAYNQAKYTSTFIPDSIGGTLSANGDASGASPVTAGTPMPDVPDQLISAGLIWRYQGFRLDAAGRYVGSEYNLDDNDGVISTTPGTIKAPARFVVDLGASYTVPLKDSSLWAKSVKFSIMANNLLDRYYYNESYVYQNGKYTPPTEFAAPGAPRAVYGKITVEF